MTPITNTFKFHIDASLFGFHWSDAQYVDVEYSAVKKGDATTVSITSIKAAPYIFSMIMLQNNWLEFNKQVEAAARHNVISVQLAAHVHPKIASAIAPFI